MGKQEKIIIIDGNALVHRAFHALPPTMKTKKGQMTNAVYGFVTILFKVIKDLKPRYGLVTFDISKKTFRHKEYAAYKATRKKQPDELYEQIPIVKEIIKAFNIPILEKEGYEADDVIGTVVAKLPAEVERIIVTGDMDTLQLIKDNTKVYTLKKGVKDTIIYDAEAVKERFLGLGPKEMIDYKALRGDASDNIPGVKGIGEKGAIELLNKYKNIENLYDHIGEIKGALKEKLLSNKASAFLSKKLATIVCDLPLEIDLKKCELNDYNQQAVVEVLQRYELKNLLAQLQNVPRLKQQQSLFDFGETHHDASLRQNKNYHLINNEKELNKFIKILKKQKIFALDTEADSLDFMNARIAGISISFHKDEAYFIDLRTNSNLLNNEFRKILESDAWLKIGHNIKYDMHILTNIGVAVQGVIFDTMIASYLLNPGTRQHGLDKLAFSEFGYNMASFMDLVGKGKEQKTIMEVEQQNLTNYACSDADYTFRLYEKLLPELKQKKIYDLFNQIEMPLVSVLQNMERQGVIVDKLFLKKQQKELALALSKIEKKIYSLAGEKFNIASSQQLKEILFNKLHIGTQTIKKIKTGFSTAAAELVKMRNQHEIIPLIEDYRELSKLLSTYIEALPELIDKKTKRVHTSYNQTVTATGRLSSSDPNLQNIPIRTELGKRVRQAFIAPPGYKILAADYSQIELRIIASLANDKKMIASFKNGEDIHRITAAEINNIEPQAVTPELRRAAKSINFGIIYGMGAYGLSQDAGLSQIEAQHYIDKYFLMHPEIQQYLEKTKEQARHLGFVQTVFGRLRYIPEINSEIFSLRQAAERMAINMPIQGTAADLIKKAMIIIDAQISQGVIPAKMIMQVHDELVFEVEQGKEKIVSQQIEEVMKNIYSLRCPLVVNIGIADNWEAAK